MGTHTRTLTVAAYLLSLACVACARQADGVAQGGPRDEDAEASAAAYLSAARVTVPDSIPDTLTSCEVNGPGVRQLALASFHLTGSRAVEDTAQVTAVAVSAAVVTQAPGGWDEVRAGSRVDTLALVLTRRAPSRWAVCYVADGTDFVRLDQLGPSTRWLDGASLANVMALADSLSGADPQGPTDMR